MASRRKWLRAALWLLLLLFLLAGIGTLASPWGLERAGQWLVSSDGPERSDAILVLAGDYTGNRILKGAELAREGYAPRVYVSGPGDMYGRHESEFSIDYAVSKGYPREMFRPLPHLALSTLEEARTVVPRLRSEGVRTLLLVTSDYHTRRARSVYRRVAPDLVLRVVAAPSPSYDPARWWQQREGRKTFLLEFTKTLADWLGV